jgi:FemAB-related protein (PEP-CTERM system-associated)
MTLPLPAAAPPRALVVRSDVSGPAWDDYVSSHPEATGYHLLPWKRVVERVFGHRTAYLVAESGGRVAGVLPLVAFRSRLFGRFLVSMPFLNYGGILADDDAAATVLLEAATREAASSGASWIELRHTRRVCESLHPKMHKVAMRLPLRPTTAEQWDALDRKVRNQVRKADKSGITVASGGAELLDGFYDVFARNMRDLGTPVYPKRFFQAVLEAFPVATRVFAARLGDQTVAGSIVFRWRRTTEVPWASSLREHNPLCANVRLYWEMLQDAIAAGSDTFDFGRSTPNESTYHFKKQWEATPVPLVWEYWTASGVAVPDLSPKNARFERAIAAWRRLPVGVTRVLGPHIVRNIP